MSPDLEAELRDSSLRSRLTAWTSVWWDLRTVMQVLHDRACLPSNAYSLPFTRRAMIDGALVTYGRVFVGGIRHDVVDLMPLVESLGLKAQATHEEAMRWRHRHAAHRLEKDWEQLDARLLWSDSAESSPTMRIRLVTVLGPDDEFANELKDHSQALADHVVQDRLIPLKEKYFAELDPRQLTVIKNHHAKPYEPPEQPEGALGVTVTLGNSPDQSDGLLAI